MCIGSDKCNIDQILVKLLSALAAQVIIFQNISQKHKCTALKEV